MKGFNLMDPNTRGWLRNFCDNVDPAKSIAKFLLPSGYEEAAYRMIQPSGIMYGHPAKQTTGDAVGLDPVARMKLIFVESLINIGCLRLKSNHPSLVQEKITQQLIPEISDYFLNLYPHLYQGRSTSYLNNPYYLAENIIGKRISIKASLMKNYLASLFHNSLLFLDVFYFGEWVSGLGSKPVADMREEKAQLRLTVLGIMALAATADRKLQKEERSLFEFYLQSAGLNNTMQREARALLNDFGKLSEIDIPQVDSWLLRRYLLEMAVLVALADRKINEPEHQFIVELGAKLKFSSDEVSQSMLAVEGFVLDNWTAMDYLLGRHNLEKISSRFMIRFKGFINENKDHVIQEIQESKELFTLLGQSRTRSLTIEEKYIVNEQLKDIIKTIPAFVIIALPFTFITLPTLLALLPKQAFPSSFQE